MCTILNTKWTAVTISYVSFVTSERCVRVQLHKKLLMKVVSDCIYIYIYGCGHLLKGYYWQ